MKFKIKKKPLEYDIKDKRRFAFIPTKVTPEPQGKGDEDYYVWLECYQQQYIYSYGEVTIWDGKKGGIGRKQ